MFGDAFKPESTLSKGACLDKDKDTGRLSNEFVGLVPLFKVMLMCFAVVPCREVGNI